MTHDQPRLSTDNVLEGREEWFLLAHEIEQARDAYLNGMGQPGSAARRTKLEELLWNDKGTIVEALRFAATRTEPLATPDISGILASCKGEHLKFEEWAAGQKYDMAEHPLHYLFTDPKTYAARQGWKAALRYVETTLALSRPQGVR